MINLMLIFGLTWIVVTVCCRAFRHIRALRTFYAKRQAVFFCNEPFLWMRRIR